MRGKKKINKRYIILAVLLAAVMVLYNIRLAQIQVADAGKYLSQADTTGFRKTVVPAARGEILDRYGRPLALNRDGYNVVFNGAYFTKAKMNNIIKVLTGYLSSQDETWTDNMPLSQQEPFDFTADEKAVDSMKEKLGLAHYATADNCFAQMVTRYQLEGVDRRTQRIIMGVRYSMDVLNFSVSNPFTFSEDISTESMIKIMEASKEMPGVDITIVPIREYVAQDIAPHLVGSIGKISAEEWTKLRDSGYSYSDKVGKSGIEKAAEDQLKGIDGEIKYTVDNTGQAIASEVITQPTPGNTVMMSIDKNLQKVAQNELKVLIDRRKSETGGIVSAGAVVGTNVKTGEVIFSANYPSYTMDQYKNDYQSLLDDKAKPLVDRAFSGIYPPGSAFKPAVAAIGLQDGKITKTSTIYCKHKYTLFDTYQPSCLGYHGSTNVTRALSKSCNYFFFEVGNRVGIDKMNAYCRQLGLGVDTGIEVSATKGILAGPEEKKDWYGGDTIQAAIGQSDNAFSPLQLAVYTSTIANGGTRYQARLISQVKSYSLDKIVKANEPVVMNTVDLSADVINTVKGGMLSVIDEGTGSATFRDYKIKVGGKTGTAQTGKLDGNGKELNHSVFITFAPYDDPEIAIAVIIENGGHGSSSGSLLRALFDEYFFSTAEPYVEPSAGVLLQ